MLTSLIAKFPWKNPRTPCRVQRRLVTCQQGIFALIDGDGITSDIFRWSPSRSPAAGTSSALGIADAFAMLPVDRQKAWTSFLNLITGLCALPVLGMAVIPLLTGVVFCNRFQIKKSSNLLRFAAIFDLNVVCDARVKSRPLHAFNTVFLSPRLSWKIPLQAGEVIPTRALRNAVGTVLLKALGRCAVRAAFLTAASARHMSGLRTVPCAADRSIPC